MATDIFQGQRFPIMSPTKGFAITPSNTDDLPNVTTAIYVGGAGALAVILADGTELTLTAVPVGTWLWLRVMRVKATGTVASNLVGFY